LLSEGVERQEVTREARRRQGKTAETARVVLLTLLSAVDESERWREGRKGVRLSGFQEELMERGWRKEDGGRVLRAQRRC
jgi:hypothetical protein